VWIFLQYTLQLEIRGTGSKGGIRTLSALRTEGQSAWIIVILYSYYNTPGKIYLVGQELLSHSYTYIGQLSTIPSYRNWADAMSNLIPFLIKDDPDFTKGALDLLDIGFPVSSTTQTPSQGARLQTKPTNKKLLRRDL